MNEIVQAMVTRRSCRQYWDRPVPEELLDQVLLAGTYAANGRGRQAGRIVVLTKKEDITALEKLNAQALGNPEAQPFYGAPVVLVVLADKSVHTAVEDGSLVIGNMLLAAHALGLGACWIRRGPLHFRLPRLSAPGRCPPKREFCYKSLNFELQNRHEADILKSSQLPESLEECV